MKRKSIPVNTCRKGKRHNSFASPLKIAFSLLLVTFFSCHHEKTQSPDDKQPLKEIYTNGCRVRSGIAHGGIGTGTIELRKDGQFYNWTIFNNQPLSTGPLFLLRTNPKNPWDQSLLFFIVRYQEEGKKAKLKLLQLNNSLSEGAMESIDYYYPWMTAVEKIEYAARFPYTWLTFTDPDMPLKIDLEVVSPFIPHDVKNSSLPGIYFNFTVTSLTSKKVDVMIIATQRNLTGYDTYKKYFIGNLIEKKGYKFVEQTAGDLDPASPANGQMGIASLSDESTYYIGWEHKHPYYELLVVKNKLININDTEGRNTIDKKTGKKVARYGRRNKDQRMFSSVALTKELNGKDSFHHSFLMTWFFPNNYGAYNDPDNSKEYDYHFGQKLTKNQGHYYENFFKSATDVADYMVQEKDQLLARTKKFIDDMYASDIDLFVLDQVNSQLNTLRTSTTLTRDMKFGIREGMTADQAWGPNNTSDVSLYGSIMTISLFPELQQSAMRCHRNTQTPRGEINHGLGFDLDYNQNGTWGVYERIDLPGNYIQMVLRDFFMTNDTAYLKEMWPSIKKAIEYVLNERDKNKDQMPEMHGIMSSYDNFPMYGLASYIQSQWICALKAASIAAGIMNEKDVQARYDTIATKGSQLMDTYLWNGKYYRLANDYDSTAGNKGVDEGCLTDQIIGQWLAHQCGLGPLFKEENIHSALKNILAMSYRPDFGLRNCSWPQYPDMFPIHESNLWVDQANTCWTGVELGFASLLIYEGLVKEGLDVIRTVDNRYRRAGLYFDHQEFGGHYFRPMAAWAILNAFVGLEINCGTFTFDPKVNKPSCTLFFAFPGGTAHYIKSPKGIEIKVLSGKLHYRKIVLRNSGLSTATLNGIRGVATGRKGELVFDMGRLTTAEEGQSLLIQSL